MYSFTYRAILNIITIERRFQMASSIIHMCIAKKINQTLKIADENMLLLGSIAPDISKHVGETKTRSHFLTNGKTIDMDRFLEKYKRKLNHPFLLGYFIHLYTDLLWDQYFISEIVEKDTIHLLNGETIPRDPKVYQKMIYNDYTNLNVLLIDEYHLDLSLFYNEAKIPNIEMDEIPVDQLSKLLDHTGVIIANSKKNKAYTFTLENVIAFIETSSHLILLAIQEMAI